ncbi:hypothetical protein BS17DRAFT_821483 [Gyrodon lividus]|nr:hypothetical protein BS17DRAFT_821483 [Gyrodon lividus]
MAEIIPSSPQCSVSIIKIKLAASHASFQPKDILPFCAQAISYACYALKINHIPWSRNPTGRVGAQSSTIIHDVQLNLSTHPPPPSSPTTSYFTRDQSTHALAICSSEKVQASNPRGEWSALDVELLTFHSVLHKLVPPMEFDIDNATLGKVSDYITKAYNHSKTSFNGTQPLHQLAIIVTIAMAGLLLNAFPPDCLSALANPSQYKSFLHSLLWVICINCGGITNPQPFIVMVITFIINMFDLDSPICKCLTSSPTPGIDNWTTKHSAKGITTLFLCCFGLATPCTPHAFRSACWLQDVKPISPTQIIIISKHAKVICLICTGGIYGGYDAIFYLAGPTTVNMLINSQYVTTRSIPQAPSSKHTTRDWVEEDSRIGTPKVNTTLTRKA